MLRKLPGLIWTIALIAYVVKRFVPPETITSLLGKVQGAASRSPLTPEAPAPPASANGADLHTPMPVA